MTYAEIDIEANEWFLWTSVALFICIWIFENNIWHIHTKPLCLEFSFIFSKVENVFHLSFLSLKTMCLYNQKIRMSHWKYFSEFWAKRVIGVLVSSVDWFTESNIYWIQTFIEILLYIRTHSRFWYLAVNKTDTVPTLKKQRHWKSFALKKLWTQPWKLSEKRNMSGHLEFWT